MILLLLLLLLSLFLLISLSSLTIISQSDIRVVKFVRKIMALLPAQLIHSMFVKIESLVHIYIIVVDEKINCTNIT